MELLTRLLRQPEYPGRAEAQELIGLVRERAGQLAHAKVEYQEYLRRYPNGAAAARVSSVTRSWDARFALRGNFRIGPRLSVERLENTGLGGTQMFYLPELRADWTGRWSLFELIAGYQVEQISAQPTGPETRYLYASATCRVRF